MERKVIGRICETFGPVSNPFYVISKSPSMQPDDCSVKAGVKIFYSHQLSHIVGMTELSKRKGCDASNQFDQELDESEMECSDDEQERARKSEHKKRSFREKEEERIADGDEDGEIIVEDGNNYELSLKEQASLDLQTNVSLQY